MRKLAGTAMRVLLDGVARPRAGWGCGVSSGHSLGGLGSARRLSTAREPPARFVAAASLPQPHNTAAGPAPRASPAPEADQGGYQPYGGLQEGGPRVGDAGVGPGTAWAASAAPRPPPQKGRQAAPGWAAAGGRGTGGPGGPATQARLPGQAPAAQAKAGAPPARGAPPQALHSAPLQAAPRPPAARPATPTDGPPPPPSNSDARSHWAETTRWAAGRPLTDAARHALLAGGDAPTVRDGLLAKGITLKRYTAGEHRELCPKCGGGTTGERALSITIAADGQSALWHCFRATCGFSGSFHIASGARETTSATSSLAPKKAAAPVVRPSPKLEPLNQVQLKWFADRGISAATLERNGVAAETLYISAAGREVPAIAFPYKRGAEVVNVKYRTQEKHFQQVKGAEKILYGLDDIAGESEIIIVEGEVDKLSLEEAGYRNVVSVPDGAPRNVKEGKLPDPEEDTKFSYLWSCRGALDMAARIIIATDMDEPGNALAEELARRLGRERCWRARWPDQLKDANDVLVNKGVDAVAAAIKGADAFPIRGLFSFADFEAEIWSSWLDQTTDVQGVSTGWKSLDSLYRIVPGELSVVTGVPNSGKSEWIDALMCNLTEQEGWSFALCSMEKKARDHARQLLEKHVKKPFFESAYAAGQPRMSQDELTAGLEWLANRFYVVRYEDEALPSVEWVLEVARVAVLRHGIRGLVIDPYNELDHQRPAHMTETEYVSSMLTKIKRFAQHNDVHVWFVAHPRQLQQWRGEAPNLYDISGSAHFVNKADNGIVVHRVRDDSEAASALDAAQRNDRVQILVRKVRNKSAGTIGESFLKYDRRTGRYADLSPDELAVFTGGRSQ